METRFRQLRSRQFLLLLLCAVAGALSCSRDAHQHAAGVVASPDGRGLRLVTYNIKHAHGMDGRVDLNRVAAVLRPLDADVIFLQEVDHNCVRSGRVDQTVVLADALGMKPHFGPFRPYDGGLYGMAILTRGPIRRAEVVPLPPGPNPIAALELDLEAGGRLVTITGLHLVTTEAQRVAQAEVLLERYRDASAPVILAGDLNSERGSVVLDAFESDFEVPAKDGQPLTFPSVDPVKEIDFILLSRDDGWQVAEHRVLDERAASDHRPVLMVVEW